MKTEEEYNKIKASLKFWQDEYAKAGNIHDSDLGQRYAEIRRLKIDIVTAWDNNSNSESDTCDAFEKIVFKVKQSMGIRIPKS